MNRYSHNALIQELGALHALTPAQLQKVAAEITDEEASEAARNLKRLESSSPSQGKLIRGSLVGAVAGPVANLAMRAAAGPEARFGRGIWPGARPLLATAAHGAVFGGLMPAAQHKLEVQAEKHKLRNYLADHKNSKLRVKGL